MIMATMAARKLSVAGLGDGAGGLAVGLGAGIAAAVGITEGAFAELPGSMAVLPGADSTAVVDFMV